MVPLPPSDASWLASLAMLLWRYASLGIGADVGAMSADELYAVYCFLTRLDQTRGACNE
jgi:hypothetical protein